MNNKSNVSHEDLIVSLKSLVKSMNNHHGKWLELRRTKDDISYSWTPPVVNKAYKFLYDYDLIITFDSTHWAEGWDFLRKNDPDSYDSLDREWVLKLLSQVARSTRICQGNWEHLFEVGSGQKLFARLLEIEESK